MLSQEHQVAARPAELPPAHHPVPKRAMHVRMAGASTLDDVTFESSGSSLRCCRVFISLQGAGYRGKAQQLPAFEKPRQPCESWLEANLPEGCMLPVQQPWLQSSARLWRPPLIDGRRCTFWWQFFTGLGRSGRSSWACLPWTKRHRNQHGHRVLFSLATRSPGQGPKPMACKRQQGCWFKPSHKPACQSRRRLSCLRLC